MQFFTVLVIGFCCFAASVSGDVSHILPHEEHVTAHQPANPYIFSYSAGRAPGQTDRQHTEVSDGTGVVRGAFSYVDPRNQVRTVQYVADENGFHPQLSHENEDSAAVKLAKKKHFELYNRIAQEHASQAEHHEPQAYQHAGPSNSEAVLRATKKHLNMYQRIAAEHAALGAQQAAQRQIFESTSEHSINESIDDGQYHPEKYQ